MPVLSRQKSFASIAAALIALVVIIGGAYFGYQYYWHYQMLRGFTATGQPIDTLSVPGVKWAMVNHYDQIYACNESTNIRVTNQSPVVKRIYEGKSSLTDTKSSILASLEVSGYDLSSEQHTPEMSESSIIPDHPTIDPAGFTGYAINDHQPYWMIMGTNNSGDMVDIEITDRTYDNTCSGGYNFVSDISNFGEHPVASGKTAVVFSFFSHKF